MDDNPLWYKDAIIYQLHVRSYADGYPDGIGDFRGLTGKLDYLQDLGITAIWLLPFYPSPLKDDGYDIADYTNINPSYGLLRDFEILLREAHRRGLRVITELVLNHTSDQHPWFQRARRAPPGSTYRDYYVWSDTPEKYKDARIIFKDFEISNWTWDPVAKAYYWHRFYSHQPDLNFNTPQVREAMFQVVDFWMNLGVDGMRLDAVPYLFEREGTNCENLPETHQYLKELRAHADQKFPGRMFLAEANQWPEDAVAYFGDGDECQMAFHFPLMPRMFMAIRLEDRYPIVDILGQTPALPETSQWAVFLRNHDELTLEMVTDEERDYMYRVYAQDKQARINLGIRRRLAPLLENNRRRIELMVGVLFSMPGTPVIYYGDEIGMGDNIYLGDRNGVRTPMQWSAERNAGFSSVNPQKLFLPVIIDPEYHYQAINVEVQQANPSSLLWWMKRLIALRKQFRSFGRGTMELLAPSNHKVLALIRRCKPEAPAPGHKPEAPAPGHAGPGAGASGLSEETILVVANLARFPQWVELDLSAFRGLVPVELLAHNEFPVITDRPYPFTLGPHGFFWFSLEQPHTRSRLPGALPEAVPDLIVDSPWPELLNDRNVSALEDLLPRHLRARRGFGGTPVRIDSVSLREWILFSVGEETVCLLWLSVSSPEGEPDTQVLPILYVPARRIDQLPAELLQGRIARLRGEEEALLLDAGWDPRFAEALIGWMVQGGAMEGKMGVLTGWLTDPAALPAGASLPGPITLHRTEQYNTIAVLGEQYALKIFRRVEEGCNPELEVGQFLTAHHFASAPPVLGALEYQPLGREPMTLAVLHRWVVGAETAWTYTQGWLSRYFERALATAPLSSGLVASTRALLELAPLNPPNQATEMLEGYLESAILLGRRTAELHAALASDRDNPAFAPEPFAPHYHRSVYQSTRNITIQALTALRRALPSLPETTQQQAQQVLGREKEILQRFRALLQQRMTSIRIRTHGDYHLGQVLHTGKDFVILDFEGDPDRTISERRLKRSCLRDLAAMVRSFHYCSSAVLLGQVAGMVVRPEDLPRLEPWANFWYLWVSSRFLRGYLETAGPVPFLPANRDELHVLLDSFLLEKTLHELAYDLTYRPGWAGIPLRGLLQLLDS